MDFLKELPPVSDRLREELREERELETAINAPYMPGDLDLVAAQLAHMNRQERYDAATEAERAVEAERYLAVLLAGVRTLKKLRREYLWGDQCYVSRVRLDAAAVAVEAALEEYDFWKGEKHADE